MASPRFDIRHRSRELRRRVVLPARVRQGANWSDACILNVSTRGLMIQATRAAAFEDTIELRRGPHVIVAHVMWRDGLRLGLRVDDPLPVCEILIQGQERGLQLALVDSQLVDRRKQPRSHSTSRLRARAMEFASVAAIASALSIAVLGMLEEAFAAPLAQVQAALSD